MSEPDENATVRSEHPAALGPMPVLPKAVRSADGPVMRLSGAAADARLRELRRVPVRAPGRERS